MISSTSNPRIKHILSLKKSAKSRREEGCFLAEGPRFVFEVPKKNILEMYITEEFYGRHKNELEGYSYELIGENVCRHLSDTKTPQGILAIVKRQEITLEEILKKEESPLFLVLENLQDPGNLGTIIRTGEGAGVTAILMNEQCVDPYNPKVVRSTMGAILRVPVLIVKDLIRTVERLKKEEIDVYAAHLKGKLFYDYDYNKGCAFLIGNEGNGLSDQIAGMATDWIKIPMKGRVESLNAAVASTVIMYEVQRQRGWR